MDIFYRLDGSSGPMWLLGTLPCGALMSLWSLSDEQKVQFLSSGSSFFSAIKCLLYKAFIDYEYNILPVTLLSRFALLTRCVLQIAYFDQI